MRDARCEMQTSFLVCCVPLGSLSLSLSLSGCLISLFLGTSDFGTGDFGTGDLGWDWGLWDWRLDWALLLDWTGI